MEFWLERVVDPGQGAAPPSGLIDPVLRLGRDPSNDLVLDDGSVSRMHATIELYNDEIWVRDLGSTNGTWIDDKLVRDARLRPGSVLRIGKSAQFVLRVVGVRREAVALPNDRATLRSSRS